MKDGEYTIYLDNDQHNLKKMDISGKNPFKVYCDASYVPCPAVLGRA